MRNCVQRKNIKKIYLMDTKKDIETRRVIGNSDKGISKDTGENWTDAERKKVQFEVLPQGKAAISRLSSSFF